MSEKLESGYRRLQATLFLAIGVILLTSLADTSPNVFSGIGPILGGIFVGIAGLVFTYSSIELIERGGQ